MSGTILGGAVVLGDRSVSVPELAAHLGRPAPEGVARKRIADIDEDAVTLAVRAARQVVSRSGVLPAGIGEILVSGLDSDDGEAVFAEALASSDVPRSRFAATPEKAMETLLSAGSRHDGQGKTALVVLATDGRGQGVTAGAGAAAFLIGAGKGARFLDPAPRTVPSEGETALGHGSLQTVDRAGASVVAHRTDLADLRLRETGLAGATGACADLVSALGHLRAGSHLEWIVPGPVGSLAATVEAGQGPYTGLDEALKAPALQTDAATAVRIDEAWPRAAHRVAQGAFVSLQQYRAQAAARYRLVGQHCTTCRRVLFPPRACCPDDPDARLELFPLSGRGTVFARTLMARGAAPTEFAPLQDAVGPYATAIVDLSEGPKVATQLCGEAGLRLDIGDDVVAELRLLYVQDHVPRYGFKFRAAREAMD